jgi:hypothetical protein
MKAWFWQLISALAEPDETSDLQVRVEGDQITVTKAGMPMWVSYVKGDRVSLFLCNSWLDPSTTSPSAAAFRARAFHAANAKARELGWIV